MSYAPTGRTGGNPPEMTPETDHAGRFPWKNIIGYLTSLILTAGAMWIALTHALSLGGILVIILLLAIVQIFVQLFFFMHVTERHNGPRYHVIGLTLGLIFTFAIVAGSIWIMTFNSQAS